MNKKKVFIKYDESDKNTLSDFKLISKKYNEIVNEIYILNKFCKEKENQNITFKLKLDEILDLLFAYMSLEIKDNIECTNDLIKIKENAIQILKSKLKNSGYNCLDNIKEDELNNDFSLSLNVNELENFDITIFNYSKYKINSKLRNTLIKFDNLYMTQCENSQLLETYHELQKYEIIADELLFNTSIYFEDNIYYERAFYRVEDNLYSLDGKISTKEYDLDKKDIDFISDNLQKKGRLINLKSKDEIPLLMLILERFDKVNMNNSMETIGILLMLQEARELNKDVIYNNILQISKENIKNNNISLTKKMEIIILSNQNINKIYNNLKTKEEKEAFYDAYYNLLNEKYLIDNYNFTFEELNGFNIPFTNNSEININVLKRTNNKGLPPFRLKKEEN